MQICIRQGEKVHLVLLIVDRWRCITLGECASVFKINQFPANEIFSGETPTSVILSIYSVCSLHICVAGMEVCSFIGVGNGVYRT